MHQVFDDGFAFLRNFGGIFEVIFYQKKIVHQVFDDGFTFWSFGQFLKRFSTREKVAHQVFDDGFTFCTAGPFGVLVKLDKFDAKKLQNEMTHKG